MVKIRSKQLIDDWSLEDGNSWEKGKKFLVTDIDNDTPRMSVRTDRPTRTAHLRYALRT
jgi:hypothetical protein